MRRDQGWIKMVGWHRYHYFVDGESLCKQHSVSVLENGDHMIGHDRCKACERKLLAFGIK